MTLGLPFREGARRRGWREKVFQIVWAFYDWILFDDDYLCDRCRGVYIFIKPDENPPSISFWKQWLFLICMGYMIETALRFFFGKRRAVWES